MTLLDEKSLVGIKFKGQFIEKNKTIAGDDFDDEDEDPMLKQKSIPANSYYRNP